MFNVLILAAGQGTRLRPLTNNIPKCMVKIKKNSLLNTQLETIKNFDYNKIFIATGYKSSKIKIPYLKKIYNPKYKSTNMLYTLFYSMKFIDMKNDLIISYGDIVYDDKVLYKIIKSKSDISVVADLNWYKYWKLRFKNPLDDAETLKFNNKKFIKDIGKKTDNIKNINGQYIGLIKIKKNIFKKIFKKYEEINIKDKSKYYLTDFLQKLIDQKMNIKMIPINSGWLEIDSTSDLNLIKSLVKNGKITDFIKKEL